MKSSSLSICFPKVWNVSWLLAANCMHYTLLYNTCKLCKKVWHIIEICIFSWDTWYSWAVWVMVIWKKESFSLMLFRVPSINSTFHFHSCVSVRERPFQRRFKDKWMTFCWNNGMAITYLVAFVFSPLYFLLLYTVTLYDD